MLSEISSLISSIACFLICRIWVYRTWKWKGDN
jgi:hypothetical protein